MIKLVSQNFYKELSTAAVNWLLANVGDKIRVETTFTVQTYVISTLDNPFILNNTDGTIGTGWIQDPAGQFADLKVGDTVIMSSKSGGSYGSYTISDKIDDSNVQFSSAITFGGVTVPDNTSSGDFVISVSVPITAIKYRWNFVENSDETNSFNDLLVGTEHLMGIQTKLASDTAPSTFPFLNELSYQEGSATIEGVSIATANGVYTSTYKIIHYTKVTPFLLAEQIEDVEDNIQPAYFLNNNCWKFITQIEAAYVYSDPNYFVSEIYSTVLGNSGWYDENFNTGTTKYSVDSITYADSDGESLNAVALSTDETTVTITVKNTSATPFSNNNTKFVLGFFKVASTDTEYKQNGKTMDANFLYDRALQTVGSASVNGDQYGVSDRQVLKTVVGTYVSTSEITITCKIAMLTDVVEALTASETPRYLLFVSVQNHTLATNVSDLVTLKCDMQEFYVNTTDATMIVVDEVKFIRHPETDVDTQGIRPSLTTEFVTNGDFATSLVDWTNPGGNFTWSGGKAVANIAVPGAGISQALTNLRIGQNYVILFTVTGYAAGTGEFYVDATLLLSFSSNATFTVNFTATAETHTIKFVGDLGCQYSLDDVSFKEELVEFECFNEDEIVATSKFYLDRDGREDDDIVITSVQNKIVAKNSATDDYFELDGATIQTSFYDLVGEAQYINASLDRSFHIPEGTIRKAILLTRRTDLDGSDKYWYQLNFPFLLRWEYWVKALDVDADFFDATDDQNGQNEFWFHYATGSWGLYNKVIINATKNGEAQQYIHETQLNPNDYSSNPDFTTKTVKTYDPDTLSELYDSATGKRFLLGYKDTLVKAVFEKVSLTNYVVVIGIEVYEEGGYYGKRRMSSLYASDSDTWFKSIDDTDKVSLSQSGDVVTAQVLVDYTKIPAGASFKLTARIYDGYDVSDMNLLTDDSVTLTTDDDVIITVD